MFGGPNVYRSELAQFRWAAVAEAQNLARSNPDPEVWKDGQLAFELERSIAHDHEGLRDRLANYVGFNVSRTVQALYPLAADVASGREALRRLDNRLVRTVNDYNSLYEEVKRDPLELGRYYRLRSVSATRTRWALAGVFIAAEFIITGFVFDDMIPMDIPLLGFVVALGVMVMLVAIPHFAAQGIKEGITDYHGHERAALKAEQKPIPGWMNRLAHLEEQDDRGFRLVASVVGLVLLLSIIPLSILRAAEIDKFTDVASFWVLLLFFILVQLGISGYFFLREWLDHGMASHNLEKLAKHREELELQRETTLQQLSSVIAAFYTSAEELIFFVREAPRWDSYLIQCSQATMHHIRHAVAVEHPELGPFITWARIPYHGRADAEELEKSEYPLDPLSHEHRSLDEEGLLGREWWMREAGRALAALPPSSRALEEVLSDTGAAAGAPSTDAATVALTEPRHEDVSWLLTKSPAMILREFLHRYFDLDAQYRRPPTLDIEIITTEEPEAPTPEVGEPVTPEDPPTDPTDDTAADHVVDDAEQMQRTDPAASELVGDIDPAAGEGGGPTNPEDPSAPAEDLESSGAEDPEVRPGYSDVPDFEAELRSELSEPDLDVTEGATQDSPDVREDTRPVETVPGGGD
jgi:hypothetical protein